MHLKTFLCVSFASFLVSFAFSHLAAPEREPAHEVAVQTVIASGPDAPKLP